MTWNIRKQNKNKQKQSEQQGEKIIQRNKDSISSQWDNFRHSNIHIIGVPEGEEKEQRIENLFGKNNEKNFPTLLKEIDMQLQEAQRVPNKSDPKRFTARHIIIKCQILKIKRILKAAKERQRVIYKGVPIRLSANVSKETLQARRE